ncbi:kin of IRRE-like protein 2 [Ptychodera flava]|uniref:kin of IRRE-like protein 2 n=1 Tax=Ptychodera flava TaxID=63121 RepID=UPI003969C34D
MDGKLSANLRLFILGILYSSVQANPSFITEPTDNTQIFVYGSTYHLSVTLYCGVQNLQTGQSVAWYKNGVLISNNGTMYSNYVDTNRYTVDMSVQALYTSFDLKIMISAATADIDPGFYQCVVMTTPPLVSRTARLDIFVTPQSGYLRCSIGDDSDDDVFDVVTGMPIRLACRSDPTGVPQMTTYWTREGYQGDTLETFTSTDATDDSRVLSFSWTPTNQQNHATFICTGFHPGYTTNRTCQLGPFNVQYKPIVQISPSSHRETMETQVVTFTCITDANPPATRYVWSNTAGEKFRPQGTNVIVGSDGTWMQMRNFESQDNDVYYVTCNAENYIGRSVNAVATLNINIQSSTNTIATTYTTTGSEIFSNIRTLPQVSWNPIPTEDGMDMTLVGKTQSLDKISSCSCRDCRPTGTAIAVLSSIVSILSTVIVVGIATLIYFITKKGRIPFTKYSVQRDGSERHDRQTDRPSNSTAMLDIQTQDTASIQPSSKDPVDAVQYDEISRDDHGTEHYQSLNLTPKDMYTSLNNVKVIEKGVPI